MLINIHRADYYGEGKRPSIPQGAPCSAHFAWHHARRTIHAARGIDYFERQGELKAHLAIPIHYSV